MCKVRQSTMMMSRESIEPGPCMARGDCQETIHFSPTDIQRTFLFARGSNLPRAFSCLRLDSFERIRKMRGARSRILTTICATRGFQSRCIYSSPFVATAGRSTKRLLVSERELLFLRVIRTSPPVRYILARNLYGCIVHTKIQSFNHKLIFLISLA